MPTITATTGAIDVNGIVSQLMQIERQPLTQIEQSKTGLQTKLTAVGKISSALSAFQDAARTLTTLATWQTATAKSADPKAVDATATAGAPVGNYSVVVSRLAQRQSGASASFAAASTVVGGGTLHTQMGSSGETGAGFSADSTRPDVAVTIPGGGTVSDVVGAINTANTGVIASTVKDGTSVRILLRSRDSGASNAFRLTVEASDGSGLAALAFDPTAASAVTLNQSAQDARYSLSGLELSAASNRIEGVLNNVSLDLRQASTSPVSVDIASDTDAIRKNVEKFVSTYNELNKAIAEQTKYDAVSKTAGALQGDNTFVSMQAQLRQIFTQTLAVGDLNKLSDVGIAVQSDGSLSLNASKFDQLAANPRRLQTLFANNDTTVTSNKGFARRFVDFASNVLGNDGAINGSQARLRRQVNSLDDQKSRLERRLTDTEKRLLRTYSALNTNIAQIQSAAGSFATG
jgi:flagellar hook-associated protein 2